ncbi:MAG: hypothetical protein NZ700_01465 [Gemmataceae bacterium]|nr:hypothetical protein [Gemmataceae bacterium]MDW8267171.1 hypothetical protein [Gemmataceae bacterium]
MRTRLATAFGLLIAWGASASGEEGTWRSSGGGLGPVRLGRPVASDTIPATLSRDDAHVHPAGFTAADTPRRPIVRLQAPTESRPGPAPQGAAPPWGVSVNPAPVTAYSPPVGTEELYNNGVVTDDAAAGGCGGPWWTICECGQPLFGIPFLGNYQCFKSDHCFDHMTSPLSNPFLFEDPRSLTELRPMFLFQGAPGSNLVYRGGQLMFLGTQARVAVTDRLSLVFHKLGWIWNTPNGGIPGYEAHVGFSEFFFGPKYTWLRNEDTKTISALGLQFQFPTGPAKVFQDTGNLSLVPYVTFGQNFLRSSYGSFNFMSTIGYAASVNNRRSDYLYGSLHLDFDVLNMNKFFPVLELNNFYWTKNGTSNWQNFEGRDLINFGATDVRGNYNLTMAAGLRYKFTEAAQAGFAVEFPLTGRRDLLDYRLMVDVILRY